MKGIIYIIVCILINIAGQTSIKYGTQVTGKLNLGFGNIGSVIMTVLKQPFIILGLALYVIGAFFWIGALSRTDLSFAYPVLSVGYVLILFISWRFFGEAIGIYRLIGVALIIIGMVFLAKSF